MTGTARPATLLAAAATLALVLLVAVAWWLRHPSVFDDSGSGVGYSRGQVGEPFHVGIVHPSTRRADDAEVTIHAARPLMAQGSSAAAIGFTYCIEGDDGGLGAASGPLERWCTDLGALEGSVIKVGGSLAEQAAIIMTIVPLEPGQVRVRAVELDYSSGLRQGTQVVGPFVRVRARP